MPDADAKYRAHPTYSLDEMLVEEICSSDRLLSRDPTPEQEFRGTELLTLVHTPVRALPTRLRHVAEDRIYEELSLDALAPKRRISVTAALALLCHCHALHGRLTCHSIR
jgi:hypothetical protein